VTEIVLSIAETVRDRDFTPLQAFSMYASPHLILRIPGKADTVATRFEARVYWHPTDPHGYVMDFPVETTGLPSGTTLEIDSPADNDPNISWLFPSPLRIRVP
jgi:hypothetical protein